ncbi:hypothetical protein AVEN_169904-1 [Araneus ventricosus]|uniref:Uncharacterized protein n=1 Tax=Araneus ventricosus TaxID=182803 RepID=A0A4Y2EXX4_ARAVE|nr:hypothetical protein AVEN_169904-1 [Araneus ventricosus]
MNDQTTGNNNTGIANHENRPHYESLIPRALTRRYVSSSAMELLTSLTTITEPPKEPIAANSYSNLSSSYSMLALGEQIRNLRLDNE